ncbi:[Wnt protein] O-palmitoleoyl-L-serine hydrolase [Salvia divinorum]|uniref:Pectin acetylesterase n=1 Tax=Salvia divinorum TaxID=28513 RepID=A0ABD1G822_SALDI
MDTHNQIKAILWVGIVFYLFMLIKSQASEPSLNITFITDAAAKGALCLDGSPGAYYFAPGFDDGVDNWIVFLPGGGWCNTVADCLNRTKTPIGSTVNAGARELTLPFLRPNKTINPDFYNWNKVLILYCDGASFMADIDVVDLETKLYFRGRRIFTSAIEELKATKGMANAANALLAGDSAGGLATMLNCDRFRSFLPNACRVKCYTDSGFFIQAKNLPEVITTFYFTSIVTFHELAEYLPKSCTQRLSAGLCFFPENVVADIQTPLFILNSDFDSYQIANLIYPNHPGEKGWKYCTSKFSKLENCTTNQLQLIMDFGTTFLKTLEGLDDNPSRGLFSSSCYRHSFIYYPQLWQGTTIFQNKTIQQAIGDWYFERSSVKLIDTEHSSPISCI